MEGWRPLPSAIAVAERLHVDIRRYRSQPLRRGCLAETDLVIGFEPQHATAAVHVGGAAPEQVFLLLELPPLLETLPPPESSDPAIAVSLLGELRRLRETGGAEQLPSLPDPLGEPEQVVAEIGRVIDAVTAALATAVLGRDATEP